MTMSIFKFSYIELNTEMRFLSLYFYQSPGNQSEGWKQKTVYACIQVKYREVQNS